MLVLTQINGYLPLTPSSVGDLDNYLGTKLRQTRLSSGVWAWGMSPSKYVDQAIKNSTTHLTKKFNGKYKIPSWADNPFPTDYDADLDITDPLTPDQASFFQHLIGVLR